ncbi:hypothetical protein K402DRAFT_342586 [Aulographum hederae CBS 113979]|uniref:Uncharacterized protein n=1 Tax=Aulographum hederae CBS 113979 TaxID=1176131 RepID=A0A6G1GKF0_9PEZI|nr:hypothetical protein K402DRAFT_342586 [Aulographum hederae CBS 113979]
MSLSLKSSDELLKIFDQLVKEDEIIYAPSTLVKQTTDEGFNLEFRVCPALAHKPMRPSSPPAGEKSKSSSKITSSYDPNATFGPGSDLKRGPPEFTIATVHSSHYLVFNKFCVYRPQYMLLTVDSYLRQASLLTIEDFAAAWTTLEALNALGKQHYLFYNCGQDSGNSRQHKHMQLFERPETTEPGFAMFPDTMGEVPKTPFKHFLRRFPAGSDVTPELLLELYLENIAKTKKALGLLESVETCSHNFVLTMAWMVCIPRRKACGEGMRVAPNSAGMLGMVWSTGEEGVQEWLDVGPANVLKECGVPSSET